MTLEQRGFRRLMVNPPILGFGFGHTGFDFPSQKIGFNLLMVKVRRFDVGCTNGVLRFAYHLMRMVLTIAQRGRHWGELGTFLKTRFFFTILANNDWHPAKWVWNTVFNRWVEAVPSKDQSATTVIKFLTGEVKTRFGIPSEISSDKTFVQRTLKQVIQHLHVK